jgi:DNA invertase Pin-like site-specific DNA recombinase
MQDNIQSQSISQHPDNLKESFKKYYSEKQSQAMKKALQSKRNQGYYLGNPPLGYIRSKLNNKMIIPHSENKYLILDIFERYADGEFTLSGIADELNCSGVMTKHNKMFTHNSIYGILKNKVYIGVISSPRKAYPDIIGKHSAIISKELFNKVQNILKKHKKAT